MPTAAPSPAHRCTALQGQQALFNVLKAYALHDMEVGGAVMVIAGPQREASTHHEHVWTRCSSSSVPCSCLDKRLLLCPPPAQAAYCQGMAFVAGLLLFYVPEEPAFQLFCRLLRWVDLDSGKHTVLPLRLLALGALANPAAPPRPAHSIRSTSGPNLRRLYLPGLEGLKVELRKLDWLMERFLPALTAHLNVSRWRAWLAGGGGPLVGLPRHPLVAASPPATPHLCACRRRAWCRCCLPRSGCSPASPAPSPWALPAAS